MYLSSQCLQYCYFSATDEAEKLIWLLKAPLEDVFDKGKNLTLPFSPELISQFPGITHSL